MAGLTCTGCQRPLAADDRFCPACGTPSPGIGQAVDERRIATIVIGDLVDFTGLSEPLDPERVKRLLDLLFARLGTDVTAHGGTVDKVVGDSIVALFGAPVAHEDDPERAVRAALAMQQTTADVALEVQLPLRMRIGVTTGEVLVGGLATGDSYTAMGDAVNVASRLESIADPGTVLVDADTNRATRRVITYRRRGAVTVRGRQAPVEAWAAVRATGPPGTGRRPRQGRTVGRDAEAHLLDAVLELAITRRRAHLVEISGDAGVGKRHVAESFVERARATHGALVLQARIPPYGEASMWAPAAEMLRTAVGHDVDAADPDALAAAVAGLVDEPPDADRPVRTADALAELFEREAQATGDVEAARTAAVTAIVGIIEVLARDRPVVAVLSNTQWADQAILDLMAQVLIGLRRSPVVAVTTSRDADRNHPHLDGPEADALTITWLRLVPLDEDATTELARELLGPEAGEEAIAAAVRRSGGNPLVLEEIAALTQDASGGPVEDMPMTLRGLVSARLDVLSPEERRIVEDAAVIGYTGQRRMLTDIAADRGQPDADALLEAMQDRDLFVLDATTYRFKTDALREAAYLRLPKVERALRHRDIGRRLAAQRSQDGGGGTALRRQAQHLATAAELAVSMGTADAALLAEALEALDQATTWAAPRDPGVALTFADRSIALQPNLPAMLHRARALVDLGRHDDARHAAEQVLQDAGDPTIASAERAVALTVLGTIAQARGDLDRSTDLLHQAAEEARAADDDAARAAALRTLGLTLIFRGRDDEAEAAVREARDIHERAGDASGVAWADQHLGWIAFNRGQLDLARTHAEAAEDRFRTAGSPIGLAFSHGLLGWVCYAEGDLVTAEALAEEAMASTARVQQAAFGAGMGMVLLAGIALWTGRAERARELSESAIATLGRIGHRWGEVVAHAMLARALAHLGDVAGARQALEDARSIVTALGRTSSTGLLTIAAAGTFLHVGDPRSAETWLHRDVDGPPARDRDRLRTLLHLQLGEVDQAARCAAGLPTGPSAGPVGVADAAVAALALARAGRTAEAERMAAVVRSASTATYLDRLLAAVATAWTARLAGQGDAVDAALREADALLDGVEDLPAAGLVRIARAALTGGTDPAAAAAVASGPGSGSGMAGDGWIHALMPPA